MSDDYTDRRVRDCEKRIKLLEDTALAHARMILEITALMQKMQTISHAQLPREIEP